ncbi:hypothetical protein H2248_011679 [Termitomyces sp. 'cryptogamus']|nr:hypothetical protein H2248_011679 [Termitomyces sp. 'cryptogamus']
MQDKGKQRASPPKVRPSKRPQAQVMMAGSPGPHVYSPGSGAVVGWSGETSGPSSSISETFLCQQVEALTGMLVTRKEELRRIGEDRDAMQRDHYTELIKEKVESMEYAIFLSRSAFWQGGGLIGYNTQGWLLTPTPTLPREVLYRRYCAAVGKSLEFIALDVDGDSKRDCDLSQHMVAFHKWHTDERVNSAWENVEAWKHTEIISRALK